MLSQEEKKLAVSTLRFNEQLDRIKRLQIDIIDPLRLLKPLALSKNSVLITFNEAHKSHYDYALPLLKQHQATGLFLVTTDWVEHQAKTCTWKQLAEIKEAGMNIGSHGKTHRSLTSLNQYESIIELRESKSRLDQKLKQSTRFFSFPQGQCQKRDIDLAKSLNYQCLITPRPDVLHAPISAEQLRTIPSFRIKRTSSERSFQNIISANQAYIKKKQFSYYSKLAFRGIFGKQ